MRKLKFLTLNLFTFLERIRMTKFKVSSSVVWMKSTKNQKKILKMQLQRKVAKINRFIITAMMMRKDIGYRYEIKEFLGKGSFGTALACFDHKEKREVAIKIVKNKKKYYYQASVELKIL